MCNLDVYRDARDRGTAWLLEQVNDDGSIGPVDQDFTDYRLPWTFTITGHTDAALRLCEWVRQHQFSETGDFAGISPRQVEANAYQNATFIYGAHMLRQFDLSYRGWRHLLPDGGAARRRRDRLSLHRGQRRSGCERERHCADEALAHPRMVSQPRSAS